MTGASVSLIIGLVTLYEKLIKPKLKSTKLRVAVSLINDWFDFIDCNLESGIDFSVLNNKENKVLEYIKANLKDYKITMNRKKRYAWLKEVGIKKTLRGSKDMFTQYSRMLPDGDFIDLYFMKVIGNFYTFHSKYSSTNPSECNYSEIEMPVKFLNFITR